MISFFHCGRKRLVIAVTGGLLFSSTAIAKDEAVLESSVPEGSKNRARTYTTREEKREAGLEHEITDWLTLSGLAEREYLFERYGRFDSLLNTNADRLVGTVSLVAGITPLSWAKAELVYEYDSEENRHFLDEAIGSVERGNFEVELGDFYVPFGEYFSFFVNGPLLEFGETRGKAGSLSYALNDRIDVTAFVYDGRAGGVAAVDDGLDWGFAVEGSPFNFATVAVSYLSDLADSEELFLEDNDHRYTSRVAGLSGFARIGLGQLEIAGEFVSALGSFAELDPDRDRPRAWNVELAYFPKGRSSWALRLEGSRELEGSPRIQGGVASTWLVQKHVYLTLEYLRGSFARGMAEDTEGREAETVQQIAALVSIGF